MRKQLIDLYAKHMASSVTSTAEYEALRAQYELNMEFLWFREQLDKMKTRIEARIVPGMSQQEQLKQAINMLRTYRNEAHIVSRDLFYDLLAAIFGTSWSAERLAYLAKALAAVRLPRDYFLSFTTRHNPDISVNPINKRYKFFIKKVLEDRFRNEDEEKDNLFARAIHEIFSEKAQRGYYYPKNDDNTSIVEEELKNELNNSLVFVQIAQSEMFDFIEKNYCYLEWGWARERFGGDESRILYILGEDNRDWLDILVEDENYSDWYSHVRAKKAPPTPDHRVLNEEKIEDTWKYLEKILKGDIIGAWTRLEKGAP
jgi:hypothetical protein